MDSRIGVTICDCKGQLSDYLDTSGISQKVAELKNVIFVERKGFLCCSKEIGKTIERLKDESCDRFLFAGCSPRSSLKFPEERIAQVMQDGGLSSALFEVANIREQCAWQHADREVATGKAMDLIRMAHARLLLNEPISVSVPISKRALVIGSGPAGLQAAKDLARVGIEVTLVERRSWLGGQLCQLNRIFQSESWPSVCDSSCVGPVQAKGVILSDGIEALTQTEVTDVSTVEGSFKVTLSSRPVFVNSELCISCNKCAEVCPESCVRVFDCGMSTRKAIDKEFERALPDTYSIQEDACTRCGDCVSVCPTNAIDLDAQASTFTSTFGAVFLATGVDPIVLSEYPEFKNTHPDVITSIEFERLIEKGLTRPSNGQEPEQILFVQCAGSRAGKEKRSKGVSYCSKTCCSVTVKQVDRLLKANPMAEPMVVYYRDMRTYERALEALYQQLRISGVEFTNGEVLSIEENEEGNLSVSVDPIQHEGGTNNTEPIQLNADLVVLATAQIPSNGSEQLYRLFGVEVDRYGYPIESQPRLFRPTESLVNRVFVVGSSSGPKVVQQASEQGSAAAMRALYMLTKGEVKPHPYPSQVDLDRCIKCRSCETVCPHGAIRMTEQGAVSDPAFCQSCGFCAAACPVHAAQLTNFSDEQILAQTKVAFSELSNGSPRILALLCYWCAYSAADFAGLERVDTQVNYRVIRIRCSSSVNTSLLMHMYRMGIDGILVAGCPERSCHHLRGNFIADKRIELARALMNQLGIDSTRLRFEYIGAPMQAKLMETLRNMDQKLKTLGSNPVATAQLI